MKARYVPLRIDDLSSKMVEYSGKIFEFKYAFSIDGKKFYDTVDKNFSDSRPIPEEDIQEIKDDE